MEDIGLAAILAAKKSAGITPEVNLIECVLCMPLPNMNKAILPGFESQRRCPKKRYQWPLFMSSKDFFKKINLKK